MNYVWLFLGAIVVVFTLILLVLCIRKVHPGKAGISVGLGGLRHYLKR